MVTTRQFAGHIGSLDQDLIPVFRRSQHSASAVVLESIGGHDYSTSVHSFWLVGDLGTTYCGDANPNPDKSEKKNL